MLPRSWVMILGYLTLPVALGSGDTLLAVIILGFITLGIAAS